MNLAQCGKLRRDRITEADRLVFLSTDSVRKADAERAREKAFSHRRRAACLLEKAACLFRSADLGHRALQCWDEAATAWIETGAMAHVRRCEAGVIEIAASLGDTSGEPHQGGSR